MHDLLAAQDILSAALKEAKKKNLKKITKLVVELGKIEKHGEVINKNNLEYNLKLVARGSLAEDAQVVIKRINKPKVQLVVIEGE